MTTLSVLICTYNRHDLLRHALGSLIEGSVEKPDEVVIVNGGDRRADEVVEAFARTIPTGSRIQAGSHVEIRLIKTVNKNLAASRNVGLPICTGDIIAMTDDDAMVFPDWVTQMKTVHQERPDAGAVGGPVLGTNTDSLIGKVADAITFASWSSGRYVRTLPGVNVSYKREVVDRVGLQDECLFRGEDVDYNWRVQKIGFGVYFDPRIRVYHQHRPTPRAFLQQHYMYGRAYYLVRRKWPDMYCVYPHGLRQRRAMLKAVNFFASSLYQPLLSSARVAGWSSRVGAIPVLFLAGLAWKGGMVTELARQRRAMARSHTIDRSDTC